MSFTLKIKGQDKTVQFILLDTRYFNTKEDILGEV